MQNIKLKMIDDISNLIQKEKRREVKNDLAYLIHEIVNADDVDKYYNIIAVYKINYNDNILDVLTCNFCGKDKLPSSFTLDEAKEICDQCWDVNA